MGAPAGGMNAATRTAARYCLRQGHTPIAINNGFRGLLDDNLHELSWLGVDSWMARGGSELGTNRTLPDVDLGAADLERVREILPRGAHGSRYPEAMMPKW